MFFGLNYTSKETLSSPDPSVRLPRLAEDIAQFMLVRGEHAWLGIGFASCHNDTNYTLPEEAFAKDYGVPIENCSAVPGKKGVFRRRFSKAVVEVSCKTEDDERRSDDAAVWSGVDLSQIGTEDGDGKASPFRATDDGPTEDPLVLMRKAGVNTFRMRMWNDPCADGRCNASQWSYAGLPGVLLMARRCKAAGLAFVLDLHYSDWWADPGKQRKPTAWLQLPFDDLADAMYTWTKSTVKALVDQGTPPYAVQIGNEVTHGFLWPNKTLGQSCSDGGRLYCSGGDGQADWPGFAALVGRGIQGAREGCPSTRIAIHTDLGNHICNPNAGGCAQGIAFTIKWYQRLSALLAAKQQRFDLIGLSMYPQWSNGTVIESIAELPKLAQAFPANRIYIAETSYPACCSGSPQPIAAYPVTEAGQLKYIVDVRSKLASALGKQNGGVLWWEGSESCWGCLFGSGYSPDERPRYVARPALVQGFR